MAAVRKLDLLQLCFSLNFYFSYVSLTIFLYVSSLNLSSIVHLFYLLITQDIQDEGEQDFNLYDYRKGLTILQPKNLSRSLDQPLDPMVDL